MPGPSHEHIVNIQTVFIKMIKEGYEKGRASNIRAKKRNACECCVEYPARESK
jgi:hypothetical protein